jgi:hypothetical protein
MTSSTTSDINSPIWKKLMRLAPDAMAVIIPDFLFRLPSIDDEEAWVQLIATHEGVLIKPVEGIPSLNNNAANKKGPGDRESSSSTTEVEAEVEAGKPSD